MTLPEELVKAVHDAMRERWYDTTSEEKARLAVAAVLRALPGYVEENPPEPIVVGRSPHFFKGWDDCLAYLARLADQ